MDNFSANDINGNYNIQAAGNITVHHHYRDRDAEAKISMLIEQNRQLLQFAFYLLVCSKSL